MAGWHNNLFLMDITSTQRHAKIFPSLKSVPLDHIFSKPRVIMHAYILRYNACQTKVIMPRCMGPYQKTLVQTLSPQGTP